MSGDRVRVGVKVALVHDYFASLGGSEAVALALRQLFPEAPLYTLLADRRHFYGALEGVDVRPSFLQYLPGAPSRYWLYYPLFIRAVESLDLRGYDLIISSSHGWVKNIRTRPGSLHICYCHTPLRYAWEGIKSGLPLDWLMLPLTRVLMAYVRRWDLRGTDRVHLFVANSQEVKARLQRHYGRSAQVVYPPIETTFFLPQEEQGNYFLLVSRLVPYKRVDLAVRAFTQLGLPLKVVGTGRAMGRLARIAGPTVELLGWQPRERLRELYAGCWALVLPGKEDLGMTALEAQAAGRPVIAYGEGGALETVIPGETGIHFVPQTGEALIKAVRDFQGMSWDKERIRRHALQFDRRVFLREMDRVIQQAWKQHRGDLPRLASAEAYEAGT
jgi:glycosyltransferase involved in cell wall biosynthesis